MRTVRYLLLLALLGCALFHPRTSLAEGEVLMPGGAAAVSRGGAIAAKPVDAATLMHNPAGLTELDGHQGHYGLDFSVDSLCVQPYGYYGWGITLPEMRAGTAPNLDVRRSEFGDPASTNYGRRPLDKVCNSGALVPVPQLAASLRITDKLSLALGMVAPAAVTGSQWGGSDGTIAVGNGARPTPTRYENVRVDVQFAFAPMFGAAYKALPWLSFGLALQVAMGSGDTYQVMALRAGTSPSSDMMTKLHAQDYFVPSLLFGAYAKPTRNLRLGATFNWSDGIDGSGNVTFYTNHYHHGAVGDEFVPLENPPVKINEVKLPAPFTATLAVRFVQPLPGKEEDARDPLNSERWDVEVDASYTNSGHLGLARASVSKDFSLQFTRADGTQQEPLEIKAKDLALTADRHGQDVYAVRLGGSYTVLPGMLQASLGGFYQSRGVDLSYVTVSNYSLARVGFGLGMRVRLGPVDISAAYSHVFQESIELAPPDHEPRDKASEDDPTRGFDQRVYEDGMLSEQPLKDPRAPSIKNADAVAKERQPAGLESDRARVINAGRYTAGFNVFSISVTHRF